MPLCYWWLTSRQKKESPWDKTEWRKNGETRKVTSNASTGCMQRALPSLQQLLPLRHALSPPQPAHSNTAKKGWPHNWSTVRPGQFPFTALDCRRCDKRAKRTRQKLSTTMSPMFVGATCQRGRGQMHRTGAAGAWYGDWSGVRNQQAAVRW